MVGDVFGREEEGKAFEVYKRMLETDWTVMTVCRSLPETLIIRGVGNMVRFTAAFGFSACYRNQTVYVYYHLQST